jgi:hypothetical protein
MPEPLLPKLKLGVEGDLRGDAEFCASSLSSSSTEDSPFSRASLEFEGDLRGDLRDAKGDWAASGEIGSLEGFDTTRLNGAFGIPDRVTADTTTVGVSTQENALEGDRGRLRERD